jgi:hypothetical protein
LSAAIKSVYSSLTPPNRPTQQASTLSAFTQINLPLLNILQTIAEIETSCTSSTAGPHPAVLYREILAPLFDAVRTRLAEEKPTPTSIKSRLAAIEKLVLKIDRKAPPASSATRTTYANAAAATAPNEHRANAQRIAYDLSRESARISRQILIKIL